MSETKRKILIIIVLVLVVLFGVGQFFAGANLNTTNQSAATSTSNTNSLATQIIAYAPPALASSTPVEEGSCFASSIAAPYRSDAFRCTVGNAISDPCFEIPSSANTLICGENPAAINNSSTFALQLTKALPQPDVPSSTPSNWAWLVELSDGTICSPFTGTRPFTATGDVAVYSCNGGAAGEDMIFGDLNNATSTWTAEVGSLSTSTKIFPPTIVASATVPVAYVWQ